MLDASFDAQNKRISELEALVGSVRRPDGRLRNGIVTKDSLDPAFSTDLGDEIASRTRKIAESAEKAASEAKTAAIQAKIDQERVRIAESTVRTAEMVVDGAKTAILGPIRDLADRAEALNRSFSAAEVGLRDLSASVLAGEGSAEAWSETSRMWAEHMPGTIPDEALSESDVSGDHWSSRWWANYASQIVEDGLGMPGPAGPPGADSTVPGPAGPAGVGVPAGGTANQVLTKTSATDYATAWQTPAGGGGGVADAPNDGKPYARKSAAWDDLTDDFAAAAGTATWTGISGKPATFPPSTHSHPTSEVTGLDTALAGKAPTVHTHAESDITNLVTDLAAKAALAGATFTGKVTVPTVVAGGAGFMLGQGAADPTTPTDGDVWINGSVMKLRAFGVTRNLLDQNSVQNVSGVKTFTTSPILPTPTAGDNSTKGATTAYVDAANALDAKLAGATFTGKVITPASTTGGAGLSVGQGALPSTPADGDIWMVTSSLQWQGAGATYTAVTLNGTQTITNNKTFSATANAISGRLVFNASDATRHRLNVAASTTIPAAPADGDVWSTASGFYGRVGGVTRPMSIHVGTTAPSSPITNDLWVDTT